MRRDEHHPAQTRCGQRGFNILIGIAFMREAVRFHGQAVSPQLHEIVAQRAYGSGIVGMMDMPALKRNCSVDRQST